MKNCKDLDKLFGPRTVRIRKGQQLEAYPILSTDDYYFKGETLFFQDSPSNIETIYKLTDGEFRLLYQKPNLMPDIQTGDFIRNRIGCIGVIINNKVYYKDGDFDILSSIVKNDGYITEIRRPTEMQGGFNFYDKMPVIWSEN